MSTPLRVLIVDDSQDDGLLEVRELQKGGFEPKVQQVDNPLAMRTALMEQGWDLILVDYTMPHFSGDAAFEVFKEFNLDIPFLLVSGTIGEERAVAAMKAGVNDYIPKDKLGRLVPSVTRELREAKMRIAHKQAQEALKLSEARFRHIVESNMIGILFIDIGGHITDANDAFLHIVGYDKEALLGDKKHWQALTPPEYRDADIAAFQEASDSGTFTPFEKQYIHKTGYRVDVLIGGARLDNAEKSYVCFVLDITLRKQMEENLRHAKAAAEVANRKKSEFLSIMSHELRTPLNAIIGYSEMIENGIAAKWGEHLLSDKNKKYIHNVLISANHLLELINQILDVSKIEAGKIELQIEDVDLASLIESSIAVTEQLAIAKQIQLKVDVQPQIGRIRVDPLRFKQILFNLLSNAIKFNHVGGRVVLKVFKEPPNWLVCAVQDTGIGIPKERVSELFQPFSQLDTSYARKTEGAGLGLALTKHLVEMHGGCILIESEEGMGSTFTVRLPLLSKTQVKKRNLAAKQAIL